MCELHADWGFGVGCRRPPDLEIHSAIPDYPFLVTGHASLDYGTVVVFCKPVMRNWCQWLPHISHSARTAWVHLHEREVWSCLYVPPRTSGTMEERRQVVDQYFREWDSAVTQFGPKNGRAHLKVSFFGCGDLNMHDDIRQLFESHLNARGLSWLSSTERPTHNKGRTLVFFGEMRRTMMHVQSYMMVNLAATLRLNAIILLVVDCMSSLIHMISTTMHGLSFATSASPPAMTMFLLQNFQKTVMRGQQQ